MDDRIQIERQDKVAYPTLSNTDLLRLCPTAFLPYSSSFRSFLTCFPLPLPSLPHLTFANLCLLRPHFLNACAVAMHYSAVNRDEQRPGVLTELVPVQRRAVRSPMEIR